MLSPAHPHVRDEINTYLTLGNSLLALRVLSSLPNSAFLGWEMREKETLCLSASCWRRLLLSLHPARLDLGLDARGGSGSGAPAVACLPWETEGRSRSLVSSFFPSEADLVFPEVLMKAENTLWWRPVYVFVLLEGEVFESWTGGAACCASVPPSASLEC